MNESEKIQKDLFDKIADKYELHYSDKYSKKYRERFVFEKMFKGIDFSGLDVLEAMCGTGQVVEHLLPRGANVTGLDISSEMMGIFKKRFPDSKQVCASFFDNGLPAQSFDVVVMNGGLHHIHPDVDRAVDEVYRLLRPGGYFCFADPHKGSFPDIIRKIWYRYDSTFEKNEEAIDLNALESKNAKRFKFISKSYQGNLAFLLVYNSMIFRIPHWIKRFYSPFLIFLESLINVFQGKRSSCICVCQWKKI